jgi:hypothetical protein
VKRALFVAFLVVVLLGILSVAPPAAKAWGPCNGPYGGYAGCNYYGGYNMYSGGCNGPYGGYAGCNYYGGYNGYSGGYVYNRVCFWSGYGYYWHLYCTYVRVPAYPVSGVYGYSNYGNYYGMYGGY